MKRFQFSLQSVHNLRQLHRDEAERDLARAAAEVSHASASLDEAAHIRHAALETYAATLRSGALNPHEAALRASYLAALVRREADARERVAALERERDGRRQAAAEAARQAEVTAKLRERHRARYESEAARNEQNNLDEMATVAFARRFTQNS